MKNIAVVCGGNSGEYEVSLNSGRMVMQSIDSTVFTPYYLIVKGTDWKVETNGSFLPVNKDDFSFQLGNKKIKFDAAYLIIHGTPGEDGKIQGYFQTLNIPFVGPGIECCILTMNKALAKELVSQKGITTAKSKIFHKSAQPNWEQVANELSLPLFMKPNSGGSSVATHKVYKVDELQAAFEDGICHDSEILAEEFIQGTEITCGIYDSGNELVCLPITEIRSHNDFFDYKAKYLGESDEITPAEIGSELTKKVNELTKSVYRILHCDGMVRIDFIIKDGTPYFMEVNTVPGFSQASILPQQLRAAGMDITQVVTQLIQQKFEG